MAYVPGFRYDLFVSYASEDNQDEWVEHFQARLTGELARLLGRPFHKDRSVYLDRLRLKVGQAYPEELDQAAKNSAVLVTLLSPNYVTSDWCSRERQKFQECLPAGAGFHECLIVVKVRPTGGLSKNLADAQHVDFVIPGFQEPWPTGSPKWSELVNRLAADMRDILQKLRNRCGAVFVGSTLPNDMDLRHRLVDYLSEQHFRTIPESARLDDDAAVQAALSEAVCAVHFVGGAADQALETLELSTQISRGPVIVFHPYGQGLTEAERFLIENLLKERYPHRMGPNETELKKFLEDLLTRTREEDKRISASLGLVCDDADFEWAQAFDATGLAVEYPRFLQEKLTNMGRLRRWRELIRDRHGLLFYHGRSDPALLEWLWKLADEEKSGALRRWYLDEPALEAKRKQRPADPTYPSGLDAFLQDVRRRAGGNS